MTTDPYANADRATFGRPGQTPAAPDYGISDPFGTPPGATSGATSTGTTPYGSSTPFDGVGGTDQGDPSTKQAAADEAGQVKDIAVDAASQVAGTAKDEAGNVVGEAKDQALGLLDQAKDQAGQQAGTQQQRLAGLVGSYAKQLGSMASGSEESGPLTDLTHQASAKAGELAHWLENHEPAEVLDEVRRFARRRPGAFLLGAVAAGVVVGRLTRGAVDDARSDDTPRTPAPPTGAIGQGTPRAEAVAPVTGPGYDTQLVSDYETTDATFTGTDLNDPYGTTRGGVVR